MPRSSTARRAAALLRRPPYAIGAALAVLVVVALVAVALRPGDDGAAAPTTTQPAVTAPPATTGAPSSTAQPPATTQPAVTVTTAPGTTGAGVACIVTLHGKGGSGGATTSSGAVSTLRPSGNAAGWGGREWRYFPDASYAAARTVIADAVRAGGCTRVALNGFSNGAAFAAKLYCRGETFGGTVVGVMIDDPVTDHAVEGCAPASGVRVALYWTGALEGDAKPGWSCAKADWTCEGGSTIGIAAYAAAVGTKAASSPNRDHAPFTAAPEPRAWLTGG